jgi:serine/threonine protein phosphatase PrpC
VVPDGKIATILRDAPDLQTGCQLLVDAANEAGGPDNITVLLVLAG